MELVPNHSASSLKPWNDVTFRMVLAYIISSGKKGMNTGFHCLEFAILAMLISNL